MPPDKTRKAYGGAWKTVQRIHFYNKIFGQIKSEEYSIHVYISEQMITDCTSEFESDSNNVARSSIKYNDRVLLDTSVLRNKRQARNILSQGPDDSGIRKILLAWQRTKLKSYENVKNHQISLNEP